MTMEQCELTFIEDCDPSIGRVGRRKIGTAIYGGLLKITSKSWHGRLWYCLYGTATACGAMDTGILGSSSIGWGMHLCCIGRKNASGDEHGHHLESAIFPHKGHRLLVVTRKIKR